LKLGNLFLSEKMEVKLGDFGLAAKLEFDSEKRHTICGTPNYIAPEILENRNGHSYEVDLWSLGVIIYTLTVGRPPFETPDVKSTYKKIKMGAFSFPEHIPLSENVKDCINKILCLDPSKRLTIDGCLNHPFLNNGLNIPRYLPLSTLACPPSSNYLKQYINNTNSSQNDQFGQKFASTSGQNQGQQQGSTINLTKNPNTGSTKNFKQSDMKNLTSSTSNVAQKAEQEVFVKKWVDYSTKYGLGYLLSNGSVGVFFNDCTKIILNGSKEYFEYIERRASDRVDIMSCYTLNVYPKELHKKVTLLQHFRSYLEGLKTQSTNPTEGCEQYKSGQQPLVYLKKWMKTRHAIMFRLSNKIVQVDFQDKTQIILSSESKLVTYVNKKGEQSQYPIATALESDNAEMAKRLKYTKEI
jgi:polo-like kinase 1